MKTSSNHAWAFRLGVLGLSEGRSILSAALAIPDWEVAQICDLDETLCQQRRAEFGIARHTTDYAEMLADPTVDVVAIFTPDHLHARHIIQALEAGKHGRVLSLEAHYSADKRGRLAQRKGKWESPDWLYTGLVHVADLALWNLGFVKLSHFINL